MPGTTPLQTINAEEPDLKIDLDDVKKEDTILGRGSMSVVHPALYKNERVAVKTINTGSLTITQQEAFRSVSIMAYVFIRFVIYCIPLIVNF